MKLIYPFRHILSKNAKYLLVQLENVMIHCFSFEYHCARCCTGLYKITHNQKNSIFLFGPCGTKLKFNFLLTKNDENKGAVFTCSMSVFVHTDPSEKATFSLLNTAPIKEGDTVTMKCETDGNPQPEFEFTKDVSMYIMYIYVFFCFCTMSAIKKIS